MGRPAPKEEDIMPTVDHETIKTISPNVAVPRRATDQHGVDTAIREHRKGYLAQLILTGAPLLIADLAATLGACLAAILVTGIFELGNVVASQSLLPYHGFIVFIVFAIYGLYPGSGVSPVVEMRQTFLATTLIFAIYIAGSLAFGVEPGFNVVLGVIWMFSIVTVPLMRSLMRHLCARFKWWGQPVLVFGGHYGGASGYEHLRSNPNFGLRPVGIVDDHGLYPNENVQDVPTYFGAFDKAPEIAREHRIYWAMIAIPERTSNEINTVAQKYVRHFPNLLVTNQQGLPSLWNRSFDFGGVNGVRFESPLSLPIPRLIKRALDVFVAVVGGLFCLPLIAVITLLIRSSSPGPVFYGHERIGYKGRRFKAWKFRTMFVDGDIMLKQHLESNPEAKREWEETQKLKNDPRITSVGRWLRKTSLDELPQLWNILVGQMSLVGPRPIVDAEVERYEDSFELYTDVIPGLTGLWQVSGRNNTTYPERVRLDSYYVRNWSTWMDLYILARTVKVVLLREGAY